MPVSTFVPPVSAARLLRQVKAPCLLIGHLPNIRYCTGLNVSAGYLLAEKRGFTLFVDARYSENAVRHLGSGMRVADPKTLGKYIKNLKKCGIEAEHVSVDAFGKWERQFKNTKFVQSVGAVEHFRRVKSERELACIRAACGITLGILKKIPSWLKPGVTEKDVAWKIAEAAHKAGADGMAFESIVGFGKHTSSPHHRPTDAKFKTGDLVQIDMGAAVGGYCSDYSRVYFTGKPTPQQAKAYRILSRVQRASMKRVRAGVTNHALDKEAREELEKHGYGIDRFPHALGHGVGLDIHDGVVLSGRAPKTTLKKGEVITIEPGLYFPGEFGMRIEDTVIVA